MTKKSFSGFPAGAEVTPIPNLFFTTVIPEIEDIAELKTTLHIFWLLSRRRGYPQFVTFNELLLDPILTSGISEEGKSKEEILRQALDRASQRGSVIHIRLERDGEAQDAYFINSETARTAIANIRQGKYPKLAFIPHQQTAETPLKSNIFILYEQNIGVLTPMIAEELQEAERLYPMEWIEDAFREAVALNKRSWKYISRILERWTIEGKDNGKLRRDSKKDVDRNKYIRGRYGHMVKG